MVLDTSAIAAILFEEEDGPRFVAAIGAAPIRLVSAVTRVELAVVVEGRRKQAGQVILERFMALADIEVAAVTPHQASLAIDAFRRFGRGRHAAALNIGDSFSYALARATGHALLFKGTGFARTDIQSALASG